MRTITEGSHRFTRIHVIDDPGHGGARHGYRFLRSQDTDGQASDYPLASVSFQNGPVKEFGVNGCHQEDLFLIVADRLQCFQNGPFACADNADTLSHVQAALECLGRRTKDRQTRGVEGVSVQ